MAAARQLSTETALDEMTECCICTEVYTDPRMLPCIHTFCLKCLLYYGKDRQLGATMPCPLCRKEFTIPDVGLTGIQKNFLIEQLLYARKLSAGNEAQHIPCDACSPTDGASADEAAKPAIKQCAKCRQNYCYQCSLIHTKLKASADHVQVEIGKPLQEEEIALKLPTASCEIHKGKEIELFCLECELAICIKCFITSHKNHDCADIEDVSPELRHQVTSDTHEVTVDRKKDEELLHGFEETKTDVEQHMAALSLRRYRQALLSSGRPCDVLRAAKSLHDGAADELSTSNVIGYVERPLFTPSTVLNREAGNLRGDIIEDENSAAPTVTHVIHTDNWITGVTSLGGDVFVVRHKVSHVEVFDTVTFTPQCHLQVPGLGPNSFGLAACAVNKCLYASDGDNHTVHRVELSVSNPVMQWSVASHPVGLSVNSAQNVLVVSFGGRKLQEFTTRGSLVREIQLQPDIQYPGHAVQLSADEYLISHWSRVCVVDAKGAVVRSYGEPKDSGLKKMKDPAGLAVDKQGNVLVADQCNNRLLVLDPLLSSAHEISVLVDGGLQRPYTLCFDDSGRRLNVGELSGGRLIVIDNLKDFSALRV